jgi:hypothetical protein
MAVTKKAKVGTKAAATKAGKGATKAGPAAQRTSGRAAAATSKSVGVKPAAKSAAKPKATSAAAPKKSTSVKLNDRQQEFLKKVKDAGEKGYSASLSADQRTIDALAERKLVKKGTKDKQTGKYCFLITKMGEKHLGTAASTSSAS